MKRYTGLACVACGEPFSDEDDVVVCPLCGAPHHRRCYEALGACALADRHASGEVWHPPGAIPPADGHGEAAVCPNCSAPNPKNSRFCQMCGTPIQPPSQAGGEDSSRPAGGFTPPPGTVYTGHVDHADQWELQGVSAREMGTYIGRNSFYYLRQFRSLQTSSTGWSWNWAAFLFGPFYFFYRKLYLEGCGLFAAHLLSLIPAGIYIFEYSKMISPDFGGLAVAYDAGLMDTMLAVVRMSQIAVYALMGAQALYANRLYMQKVLSDIKDIRRMMPHEAGSHAFYAQLYEAGRPNKVSVLLVMMLVFMLISVYFQYVQSVIQLPPQP